MNADLRYVLDSITDPNPLVMVIKAHLWLERSLNRMLEAEMKRPEALRSVRLQFSQKLNLVEALGVLPPDRAAVFRELNKVRNSAAHRVEWTLTEDDMQQIIDSVRSIGWEPSSGDARGLQGLLDAFTFLLGYLDTWADVREWGATNADAIATRRYLLEHFQSKGHTVDEAVLLTNELVILDTRETYQRSAAKWGFLDG